MYSAAPSSRRLVPGGGGNLGQLYGSGGDGLFAADKSDEEPAQTCCSRFRGACCGSMTSRYFLANVFYVIYVILIVRRRCCSACLTDFFRLPARRGLVSGFGALQTVFGSQYALPR